MNAMTKTLQVFFADDAEIELLECDEDSAEFAITAMNGESYTAFITHSTEVEEGYDVEYTSDGNRNCGERYTPTFTAFNKDIFLSRVTDWQEKPVCALMSVELMNRMGELIELSMEEAA